MKEKGFEDTYVYEETAEQYSKRAGLLLIHKNNAINVFYQSVFGMGYYENLDDGKYIATKNLGSTHPDKEIFMHEIDAIYWIIT